MNRRAFLLALSTAAAAGLIVPELVLPKRTFFLPPRGGWRSENYWTAWDPENAPSPPAGDFPAIWMDDAKFLTQVGGNYVVRS